MALPLRIFALSSPHSGTVFIHATLGGCGDERSGQPKKSAVDAHLLHAAWQHRAREVAAVVIQNGRTEVASTVR